MKTLKTFFVALVVLAIVPAAQAQTADEIISNYLENTGGVENWKTLNSVSMRGVVDFQGMELPIAMVQMKDGRSMMKVDFQGQTFYQNVFDGEVLWNTNQMTMAAEKRDAEATANYKLETNDFPSPFIDYKEKGYTVELIGKETVEGTETYKIKLVKEPITVDGKQVEDITFYFFDAENFVPIVVEKELTEGPGAGMIGVSKLSDYEEINGLYFPFSITEGAKGQPGQQAVTFQEIMVNEVFDASVFAFPATTAPAEGTKN
jgi:hypothetical protein